MFPAKVIASCNCVFRNTIRERERRGAYRWVRIFPGTAGSVRRLGRCSRRSWSSWPPRRPAWWRSPPCWRSVTTEDGRTACDRGRSCRHRGRAVSRGSSRLERGHAPSTKWRPRLRRAGGRAAAAAAAADAVAPRRIRRNHSSVSGKNIAHLGHHSRSVYFYRWVVRPRLTLEPASCAGDYCVKPLKFELSISHSQFLRRK